jgi:hypothetical protein
VINAQTRIYLLYETRYNIAWRIANLNGHPEWGVTKEALQQYFAYITRQIQIIENANNLVKEYASLDSDILSHDLAKIEDDITNRRMGPIQLKSTYDRIVGTMYGFFMNMHEKLPASLSKIEKEYELNANKIFKHEIWILNTLKSRLEEIMPNELLTISTNALATPPSEHGRYIPDITEEELTHSLSLSNPNFVDLKTLESPYNSPLITTSKLNTVDSHQ